MVTSPKQSTTTVDNIWNYSLSVVLWMWVPGVLGSARLPNQVATAGIYSEVWVKLVFRQNFLNRLGYVALLQRPGRWRFPVPANPKLAVLFGNLAKSDEMTVGWYLPIWLWTRPGLILPRLLRLVEKNIKARFSKFCWLKAIRPTRILALPQPLRRCNSSSRA